MFKLCDANNHHKQIKRPDVKKTAEVAGNRLFDNIDFFQKYFQLE